MRACRRKNARLSNHECIQNECFLGDWTTISSTSVVLRSIVRRNADQTSVAFDGAAVRAIDILYTNMNAR